MTDIFTNRHGKTFVIKRSLGNGETIVQTITEASRRALTRKVASLRPEQKTNGSRASHELERSDEFYEKWRADNENNLIDLGDK